MRTWPGLGLVMKRWRASPGRISSEVLGTPELSSCQPIERAPPFSADSQRSLRFVKGVHYVGGFCCLYLGGFCCLYSPSCRELFFSETGGFRHYPFPETQRARKEPGLLE